jgi:hypothetical protein
VKKIFKYRVYPDGAFQQPLSHRHILLLLRVDLTTGFRTKIERTGLLNATPAGLDQGSKSEGSWSNRYPPPAYMPKPSAEDLTDLDE